MSPKRAVSKESNTDLVSAASYFVLALPVIGIAIAFVIFLLSTSSYVRFHALQATILGIAFLVLSTIFGALPLVSGVLLVLLYLVGLVIWVFMLYQAYRGARYALPVIGKLASDNT